MSTIVVGAGVSGVFAARTLADAGEPVMVLEATEHMAGRARTDRTVLLNGQPADLGASFLDVGQNFLLNYCLKQGIALTPGVALYPPNAQGRYTAGSVLEGKVLIGRELLPHAPDGIVDEVGTAIEVTPPDPNETLMAWGRRVQLSAAAQSLVTAQAAYNPTHRAEASTAGHAHPAQVGKMCWLLADGTDSIVRLAAEGLDIRCSQPVRLVHRRGKQFEVHTDSGVHQADDVVIAVSVAASRSIGFDPVLPEWKLDQLLSVPMSQGGKVIAQYRDGDTIASALAPSVMTDGVFGLIWPRPVGPDDLVTVLALLPDRHDGTLADADALLASLDAAVGDAVGAPVTRVAGIVQDWTSEPFIGGVVSLGTGGLAQAAVLGAPIGPLHFAGEHTAEWTTGMEAAARSGLRVADEILQRRNIGIGQQLSGSSAP